MRKYRFLNNKMTQQELGKKIGLSSQIIVDIETGKRLPSPKVVNKIARLLNTITTKQKLIRVPWYCLLIKNNREETHAIHNKTDRYHSQSV
jgi:DNA-binding XRE family transcriptional regulator